MTDHLPAIILAGALAAPVDSLPVPAIVADAGDTASWRYVEFFATNIRNPNTRRAHVESGIAMATKTTVERCDFTASATSICTLS